MFTEDIACTTYSYLNFAICSLPSRSTETSVSGLNGKVGWKNSFDGSHLREESENDNPTVVRGIWENAGKSGFYCDHEYYTKGFGFYFEHLPTQSKQCFEMVPLTVEKGRC